MSACATESPFHIQSFAGPTGGLNSEPTNVVGFNTCGTGRQQGWSQARGARENGNRGSANESAGGRSVGQASAELSGDITGKDGNIAQHRDVLLREERRGGINEGAPGSAAPHTLQRRLAIGWLGAGAPRS